ncbi:MAG: alanine racemase, partial [Longimicrobiales bacterium]
AGFDWRESAAWALALLEHLEGRVRLRGVYTHFHSADAPDATPTATQWQRFQDALAQLPMSREDLIVHACNSAAVMRWPEYAADAVRPGIYLYGGDPAPDVAGLVRPRPVVSIHARIVRIKEAPPASTVGYGSLHAARGWERWATLPLGYGDGFPRRLSGRAEALVRGRRVPFVGRTSMDMTVVDISSVPDVRVGEVATVIGRDGADEILLDDVAAQAETIGYEILTGLRPRLPRVER